MKRRSFLGLLYTLCCLAGLVFAQAPAGAKGVVQRNSSGSMYVNGTVVGVGGRFGGRSWPFRLIINHYTSADDVQRLNSALQSGGQDQLLDVLTKLDAGRIAVGNNVGVTANAIIATPTSEGGTRLTVLFQRNIDFYELRYGTRRADYKFGYAEMFLDRNGNGQGTFIPAARVNLRDGNTWEVEDFGVYPARLMGLRAGGGVVNAR